MYMISFLETYQYRPHLMIVALITFLLAFVHIIYFALLKHSLGGSKSLQLNLLYWLEYMIK